MKVLTSLIMVLACAVAPAYADQSVESASAGSSYVTPDPDAPVQPSPDGKQGSFLYSSGPFKTHFGTGLQGADESWLQSNLLLDSYGFGNQMSLNFRLADHFTVPPGETWNIQGIDFFGYQTGSSTSSTLMSLNLQIWQGTPGAGGTVIWGDTSTNQLGNSWWTGTYRVLDTESGMATDRPIMILGTGANLSLPPGTYWLDWQVDGDPGFSGPWVPPITIMGQTSTGGALQSQDGGSNWAPVADGGTGTPQGLPFDIYGFRSVGNDTCDFAEVITCPPGGGMVQVFGTTYGATYSGQLICNDVSPHYPDVWYRVAGNGGEITATTCSDFDPYTDTQLLVFDGPCTGLGCVTGNDDDCGLMGDALSTVTWQSNLATNYNIMVSASLPGAYGRGSNDNFELMVFCEAVCQTLQTPVITGIGGVGCGGTTTQTSPLLTWANVPNESGFNWEVRDSTGSVIRSGSTGHNVLSADLGTLAPGSYLVRVRAFGDGVTYCESLWSEYCDFTVAPACEPLDTPTISSFGGVECGGATQNTSPALLWTDVADEDGYQYEVRDLFGGLVAGGTRPENITYVTIRDLEPADYIARVQAVGDGMDFCDSEWTSYCSLDIREECEILATSSISSVGDTTCGGSTFETSPQLKWDDIENESGFWWRVIDASGAIAANGTTDQNVTAVQIGPLDIGDYRAEVKATGDGVNYCDGDWSSGCAFEVLGEPGTADFMWWPMTPKRGQKVRFADRATGEPMGWLWEMDDGWTSTNQNPLHAYGSNGAFDVSMMCEYEHGTDTKIWTVSVEGVLRCGDEICEGEETAWSCPEDCGLAPEETGRVGGSDHHPTVPAAVGGVGGSGGTFWMTEGWVYNPGDTPLTYVVEYTPLDSLEVFTVGPFDLEPQNGMYWENIVEELFNVQGNGALWIDSAQPVSFLTRSYNVSSNGKYGQGVPGMGGKLTIARGDGEVYLIGLREDYKFRSNLFFQEVDGEWVTVEIEVFDENGDLLRRQNLDVEAHSNKLRSLRTLGAAGNDSVFVTVRVVGGDGRLHVISSVVDQVTGDPTTGDPIHLDQAFLKNGDDPKANGESHHLVAVVAHTKGAANSVWGTRFVISSPNGTDDQTVRVVYVPEYDRTGVVGDQIERSMLIGGGEQLVWEDVLIDLFSLPATAKTQGALHVYSPEALLITSRTYNEFAGGGGSLGQLIKALGADDLIDPDHRGTIFGMSHTPEARTNFGIAAFSDEDTEVELRFFSNFPAFRPLGTITRTVDAQSHLQIGKVFEELGLSNARLPSVSASVKVKKGGAAYVYASSVDNASGDPTTIEAARNN
jgi:PKD repeat protein